MLPMLLDAVMLMMLVMVMLMPLALPKNAGRCWRAAGANARCIALREKAGVNVLPDGVRHQRRPL